jgi:hypothetical protein
MKINYLHKADQQDPAKQLRIIAIHFDKDDEVAALDRAGTPEDILDYTRRVMTAFLEENANAH